MKSYVSTLLERVEDWKYKRKARSGYYKYNVCVVHTQGFNVLANSAEENGYSDQNEYSH